MELKAELESFDEGFAVLFHTDSVNELFVEQYPFYQDDLDGIRDEQNNNQ